LTYLGLVEGPGGALQPNFCLDIQMDDNIHRLEAAVTDRWEDTALRERGVRLALEVLDASQDSARLRITSPMTLAYEGEWDATGLHMADVLALPDSLRQLINWMMRRGEVSLAEVSAHVGQDEGVVRATLGELIVQGFVQEMEVGGEVRYRPRLAFRRGRRLPEGIWQALGDEGRKTKDERRPSLFVRLRSLVAGLGERGRFFLSASPVMVVFLLAEVLLLTGRESFPGPLSLIGVIVVSLLAGIFPVLLLISSRRKGEFMPGTVFRWLGHPVLIAGIYSLYLASLFLHGLVIWQGPVERACALLAGVLVLGMTITMARRGAFASRLAVELRVGAGLAPAPQAIFAVTTGGQPVTAEVRLEYPEGEQRYQTASGEVPAPSSLRYASFQLPAEQAQELKVWAHKVTPEGDSESLPALLEVHCGNEMTRCDLKLSGGQALLPLTGKACRLEITLPEPTAS